MGDRANVAILSSEFGVDERVYLYTHWAGGATPHDVQKALQALKREKLLGEKCEGSRLAASISACMTSLSRISTKLKPGGGSNDHAIIVVDVNTQRIGFANEDEQPLTYKDWSFAEYIELSAKTIDEHYRKGTTICGEIGRQAREEWEQKR
jgi:hypothetical protein